MSKLVVDAFTELCDLVNESWRDDTGQTIYSMYGHRKEIANRLLEKGKDKVYKYQKYPLIALNMPFVEEVQQDSLITVRLNIAIMSFTETSYISEQRYEKVFVPLLEPLYDLLLEQIQESGIFHNIGVPVHDRVDRLYWGNEQRESHIFNDPLDAIELLNLELKILNENC